MHPIITATREPHDSFGGVAEGSERSSTAEMDDAAAAGEEGSTISGRASQVSNRARPWIWYVLVLSGESQRGGPTPSSSRKVKSSAGSAESYRAPRVHSLPALNMVML